MQFLALLAAGLGTAFALDKWVGHEAPVLFYLAVFGSFISYIYSAPPLKLKQSGWAGNYALGSSYISLPWWAGQVGRTKSSGILKIMSRLILSRIVSSPFLCGLPGLSSKRLRAADHNCCYLKRYKSVSLHVNQAVSLPLDQGSSLRFKKHR